MVRIANQPPATEDLGLMTDGFFTEVFAVTFRYHPMTTRVQRDWKVTTGYRNLLRVGWAVIGFAVYLATAAAILDSPRVWWIVVGLAIGAMLLVSLLPEPVPRDQIVERRTQVDPTGTAAR